jgi:hypothetical protein
MAPFPERPLSVISSAAARRSLPANLVVRYLNAGAAPPERAWLRPNALASLATIENGLFLPNVTMPVASYWYIRMD